ncbi:MAG: diguanylate cyclase [Longimicrobiales bacterium]
MASSETGAPPSFTERYRVLLDIGRTLSGTLSLDGLYQAVYQETIRLVHAEGFYIALYDQAKDLATVVYFADKGEESDCDITYRGSDSEVIRTGRATIIEDRLDSQSLMLLGDAESDVTRSAMSAPLTLKGRVTGVISTQSYEPRSYDEEDLELLQGIADVAAVAIENAVYVDELTRRRQEAEQIEAIGRLLVSSLDFDEVLGKVTEAALEQSRADTAAVWLIEGTTASVRVSAGEHPPPVGSQWNIDGSLFDQLVRDREHATLDDLANSELVPQHLRETLTCGTALAIPLLVGDRVGGFLAVGSQEPRPFTDDCIRVLYRIAGQASVALDNAELHARLQALSLTDPLTGLPNRRHLQIHLEREVAAARRGRELCLILFDLDDFKRYNDTLGHIVGDQILKAFARILDEENRAMNLVARYGGDEFVTVLSENDVAGAAHYIERIHERIARDRTLAPQGVTVSSGLATFKSDQMVGIEELIQSADRNMYDSKEKGGGTRH